VHLFRPEIASFKQNGREAILHGRDKKLKLSNAENALDVPRIGVIVMTGDDRPRFAARLPT
jgi:hypothetical protein